MSVLVLCPGDSWPNKPEVRSFPDMASAVHWAEWGHCCLRADLHAFVEEPGPEPTTT